jgi:glycerol kinase
MISRIITIDQSTSATKAMLFSEDCELLHRVNIEDPQCGTEGVYPAFSETGMGRA